MTYTFKLARRLAVSRTFGMLPTLILFAACSGWDATAPDSPSAHPLTPVTVSLKPSTVTVETNQLIRFLATGRNSVGDSVYTPIAWDATGGTILTDGRFSSAAVGTFLVMGATADRVDTSMVRVVRPRPTLASIEITPDTVTLDAGISHNFLVTGRLKDGRTVPVGVTWNAAGGSIDAGGNFVAGASAGTYQVIATHTTLPIADTAAVTITVLPPEEPPAPVLGKVTLVPASATLAPAATRQFAAYARTTTGDSVAVSVEFTATGGTVTSTGLFTARATAGAFRIIAASGSLADTSTITVTPPLGSGPGSGVPFGPFGLQAAGVSPAPYTMSVGAVTATTILAQIAQARANNVKLLTAMTGGSHANYLTDGVFDYAKWKARMDSYNTAEIKDAVAQAVADGTIIGNSVMDEPNVTGGGDGNTWGPVGTMTKVRVDGMCAYVKTLFPTLTVGVAHDFNAFEPTKSYTVCDFVISQYANRKGDVTQYRDGALALARRDGHAVLLSLNILNGGVQDRDDTWDCTGAGQGGKGQYSPQCRMTAQQVRDYGLVLGPAACAMILWRYDADFMANLENVQASTDVAARLASEPAKSCRRS